VTPPAASASAGAFAFHPLHRVTREQPDTARGTGERRAAPLALEKADALIGNAEFRGYV